MTTDRQLAIWVGIFFILATGLAIGSLFIIEPVTGSTDFLLRAVQSTDRIVTATIVIVFMGLSCAFIAVSAYPILRRVNQALAIGYLTTRIMEGTVFVISSVAWLMLVPLGKSYIADGSPEASYQQTVGDMLIHGSEMTFTIGAELLFGLSALILNYLLIKSRLVPLPISVWGFIGGGLLMISGALNLFGFDVAIWEFVLTVPIALNEMVLALWLITKGFQTDRLAH